MLSLLTFLDHYYLASKSISYNLFSLIIIKTEVALEALNHSILFLNSPVFDFSQLIELYKEWSQHLFNFSLLVLFGRIFTFKPELNFEWLWEPTLNRCLIEEVELNENGFLDSENLDSEIT